MVIKIIRWLLGFIKFEVTEGFPERLVNFAVKNKITIWDIKKIKGGMIGKITAKEYDALTVAAKECGCKIKVIEKKGLPFKIKKYKKHKGILLGAALFSLILYSLSSYVWSIKVVGNSQIPTEEILNIMDELGVSVGTLKKRINIPTVKQEAMIKLPDIAWISINLTGSHIDITVKEKIKPPDFNSEKKPCDIRAKCDGKIDRIETYKGTPAVNSGDAVLKGQLLISGVVENSSGTSSFVNSDGKVYAYTKRVLEESINLSQEKAMDTGKVKKKYRIKIFGIEIPFGFWYKNEDTDRCEFYSNKLQIGKTLLPVVFYKEERYEQIYDVTQITYEQALNEAKKNIQEREKNELNGKKIVNFFLEDRQENDKCILSVTYDCLEDIGEKEEININ